MRTFAYRSTFYLFYGIGIRISDGNDNGSNQVSKSVMKVCIVFFGFVPTMRGKLGTDPDPGSNCRGIYADPDQKY